MAACFGVNAALHLSSYFASQLIQSVLRLMIEGYKQLINNCRSCVFWLH